MNVLSDAQIAALSPAERYQLIQRLERPLSDLGPTVQARRIRWGWLGIMTGGTLVLIPWVVYLSFALPDDYLVYDWTATWVGFDLLLLTLMAASPRSPWTGPATWPSFMAKAAAASLPSAIAVRGLSS